MARVPLKLNEMIDADALRAELTALTGADGDGPELHGDRGAGERNTHTRTHTALPLFHVSNTYIR